MYILCLPANSALAIDDNGGVEPWSLLDHLAADIWLALAQANVPKGKRPKDHPRREERNKRVRANQVPRKVGKYERVKARNARLLERKNITST